MKQAQGKGHMKQAQGTYALAIRKETILEGASPVIILKQGLSSHQARESAERMNRTHLPEAKALGGSAFVAFNTQAE